MSFREGEWTGIRDNEIERVHCEDSGWERELVKEEQKRGREDFRAGEGSTGNQLAEVTSRGIVHQVGEIVEFYSKKIVEGILYQFYVLFYEYIYSYKNIL